MNFDFCFDFSFADKVVYEKPDFARFCEIAGYPRPYDKQIEMMSFCFDGESMRMLLGARRYGKTDYATICGSAYRIIDDNQYSILIITKDAPRGRDIVAEIREVLAANGATFKTRAKSNIRLAGQRGKDANISCLSVRSKGLRGRHPDLIIFEDPITPADTREAERETVFKAYEEACKLTHNIVIIGQPAHKLDLYQKLRGQIPTMLVKYGEIAELDVDLDVQRAAGVSEASIQASYFLEIMESDSLPLSKIKVVDYAAKRTICWIDPAREGEDYTALAIGGRNLDNFIVTGFCWRRPWHELIEQMRTLKNQFNIEKFVIETNGIGNFAVLELQKSGCPCVGFNTVRNKHDKIMSAAAFVDDVQLSKIAGMPAEYIEAQNIFIEQVKNYEYHCKHDDAPDALSSLVSYVRG